MAKIGIFVGTVYGNAQMVAEEAQTVLQDLGHEVTVFDEGTLGDWEHYRQGYALVITSTTGQGNFPDSIESLFFDIKEKLGHQSELHYGVIALGDGSYENFCGAGKQFDALLQEHGAQRVGDVLLVDATEVSEPEVFAAGWIRQWGTLVK